MTADLVEVPHKKDHIIRFMDAKRLVETSSKVLMEEDPSALLCSDPECQFCRWGRRKNQQVLAQ